jgi:hypothetical protein
MVADSDAHENRVDPLLGAGNYAAMTVRIGTRGAICRQKPANDLSSRVPRPGSASCSGPRSPMRPIRGAPQDLRWRSPGGTRLPGLQQRLERLRRRQAGEPTRPRVGGQAGGADDVLCCVLRDGRGYEIEATVVPAGDLLLG